ncbi:MAG: LysM peptidoglycan-binding domain-containing protein [Pseudanabaena sp.]|jgi:LysM repeat protein|nr:LysM peptidoglycan-binding domain-containing protein [Pseudanabaena sp. M53BS1SP1A06MG]MCA6581784.1 LysM peptidoglycan-binding domain-containing protein [Pseudanabaena sp. M34BS1SP1A06MG]MCA6593371.1 LysM peptidoglycan-binding domain-containing protein [Pseudanabaena sp. M38BS1SP1A06MG]MCA6596470.1 LysM peptidoglycan-binding domain-containing protein [Pseudanabaena sp. M046S1SP1A06QC]MCA6600116.1 LysM peptidoglycan-binding domain-containing protein [Pseudanabaena sp. M57BS1SP1A06MG]
MQEYIVQAGDTLSSIARRFLGANGDWREIARINNITNPASLQIGQRLLIPNPATPPITQNPEVVMVRNTLQGVYPPNKMTISFTKVGNDLIANLLNTGQQERFAKIRDLGLYRFGIFKLRDFIIYSSGLLQQLQMSSSEINVMLVTAANEGSLDAINTWDNQYLSFGIFQWTLGSAGQTGELPALLSNLKRRYPTEFQYYFGQFGVDAISMDGVTGWLSLNGKQLVNAADKNIMRQPIWALRFAIAGMDALVQSVQVLHAISRLDQFYFRPSQTLQGFALSQLLTSEFAVALLLDHHVNRPSHVIGCVADAIARSGLTAAQIAQGSRDNESLIIQNYLILRETYGGANTMTKSRERAESIRNAIATGNLSTQRFSFRSNRQVRV